MTIKDRIELLPYDLLNLLFGKLVKEIEKGSYDSGYGKGLADGWDMCYMEYKEGLKDKKDNEKKFITKKNNLVEIYFEEGKPLPFIVRTDKVSNFNLSDKEYLMNGHNLKQCSFTIDDNAKVEIYDYFNEKYGHQLKEVVNEVMPNSILLTNDGLCREINILFPNLAIVGDSVEFNFYTYSDQADEFLSVFKEVSRQVDKGEVNG